VSSAGPGPLLVWLGAVVILVGLLVWSGALGWFGRLPGDIRIEREGLRVYIPLVSMLLLSAALSLLLYLFRRFR
jgi:di/tricarboxylate transporter